MKPAIKPKPAAKATPTAGPRPAAGVPASSTPVAITYAGPRRWELPPYVQPQAFIGGLGARFGLKVVAWLPGSTTQPVLLTSLEASMAALQEAQGIRWAVSGDGLAVGAAAAPTLAQLEAAAAVYEPSVPPPMPREFPFSLATAQLARLVTGEAIPIAELNKEQIEGLWRFFVQAKRLDSFEQFRAHGAVQCQLNPPWRELVLRPEAFTFAGTDGKRQAALRQREREGTRLAALSGEVQESIALHGRLTVSAVRQMTIGDILQLVDLRRSRVPLVAGPEARQARVMVSPGTYSFQELLPLALYAANIKVQLRDGRLHLMLDQTLWLERWRQTDRYSESKYLWTAVKPVVEQLALNPRSSFAPFTPETVLAQQPIAFAELTAGQRDWAFQKNADMGRMESAVPGALQVLPVPVMGFKFICPDNPELNWETAMLMPANPRWTAAPYWP